MNTEQNFQNSECSISDLGRNGLTYDFSKMKLNKRYFFNREDVLYIDMLWQLMQSKITEQAQKLNAEVLIWEDVIKNRWYLMLLALK